MNRVRFWWRYVRHNTPWDTQIVPPEIVALIALPGGKGLGSGRSNSPSAERLTLAVVRAQLGIDFVPAAIQRARQKANGARLPPRFYIADASQLAFLSESFDFAIDIGCLHSLSPTAQQSYASHLGRLTSPGARYALYAFTPRLINGRAIGLTGEAISALFAPSFRLEAATLGNDKGVGPAAGWYYLRRT